MAHKAIMTNVGRNKEAAALANGTALEITHIAWGDGDRVPGGGEVALLNEQGRKEIQASGTLPDNLNGAFFEIELGYNDGPYLIREVGLFDADGDLIALQRCDPLVNKALNTDDIVFQVIVVFSDLQNLILNVRGTGAYVPVERKIIAQNGAKIIGDGSLAHDVTIEADFATDAEADAGLRADKVMSPSLVKRALAALVTGSFMTTLAAACGFSASFAANGHVRFPTWLGGFVIQWCAATISYGGPLTGVWSITYPTACLAAVANDVGAGIHTVAISGSATGWTARSIAPDASVASATIIRIISVGK